MRIRTINYNRIYVASILISFLLPYSIAIVFVFVSSLAFSARRRSTRIPKSAIVPLALLLFTSGLSIFNAMIYGINRYGGFEFIEGVRVSGFTKILAAPIIALTIILVYYSLRSIPPSDIAGAIKTSLLALCIYLLLAIPSANFEKRLTLPVSDNPNVAALVIFMFFLASFALRKSKELGAIPFAISTIILVSAAVLSGSKSVAAMTILIVAIKRWPYVLGMTCVAIYFGITKMDTTSSYAIERLMSTFDFAQVVYRFSNQWLPAMQLALTNPWGLGFNFIYSTDGGYVKIIAEAGFLAPIYIYYWFKEVWKLKYISHFAPISLITINMFNENPMYNELGLAMIFILSTYIGNIPEQKLAKTARRDGEALASGILSSHLRRIKREGAALVRA